MIQANGRILYFRKPTWVVELLFSLLDSAAGITFFSLDTDYSAAIRGLPFFLLIFQEFLDTIYFDITQILNRTHYIFFL